MPRKRDREATLGPARPKSTSAPVAPTTAFGPAAGTPPAASSPAASQGPAAPAPPPPPSSRSRILIIDDHPIVRERLAELISQEPDLMVCGEADDAHSAMQAIDKTVPDLALVDITLKDTYGIELVKDIKAQHPQVRTLVVSMHDESLYAERALRAGARGYVTKQEASKKVIGAIRQVLGGGIYVSEKMAGVLLGRIAGEPRGGGRGGSGSSAGGSSGAPADRLSDRELEVFQLLGEGLPVREIARRLHVSAKTVEAHRTHIKEKLNIRTSPELLRYAIQTSLGEQA